MSHVILSPFQLLELNVISAQDLAKVSRKMKTYAVAWIHPDRKLSTRIDSEGRNNPTWNDKFVFRVDDRFLHGDTSAVMIEIYALHWFRDIHVGHRPSNCREPDSPASSPPSQPVSDRHALRCSPGPPTVRTPPGDS
ncbi:INGRESSION PROTEIN FIC1 [Salix koriyanagi]|uniref:INGRESSION PROTEIN FIC1 n=1 Tax=Salix koriyanagi TaxID=2511006 RepID=A0A9Q0WLC7_9ROSI|nr:INGRESSION PROTEIN FIC1 [Salix koriyanagi]